jgi:hypothetical protein
VASTLATLFEDEVGNYDNACRGKAEHGEHRQKSLVRQQIIQQFLHSFLSLSQAMPIPSKLPTNPSMTMPHQSVNGSPRISRSRGMNTPINTAASRRHSPSISAIVFPFCTPSDDAKGVPMESAAIQYDRERRTLFLPRSGGPSVARFAADPRTIDLP